MSLNNRQVAHWIGQLRRDLAEHRRKPRLAKDKRLKFLSTQYERLALINRAIRGEVLFIGAPPIGDPAE